MLRAIYQAAGLETGLVGTICNKIGEEEIPSERTTPEANILQELLFRMLERKIGTCIMEVSSQAAFGTGRALPFWNRGIYKFIKRSYR